MTTYPATLKTPDGMQVLTHGEARMLVDKHMIRPTGERTFGPAQDYDWDEVQDALYAYHDHDPFVPEDTPSLENCDDAGTGEGKYHGRM